MTVAGGSAARPSSTGAERARASERAAGRLVALADLIVCGEEDRLRGRRGRGGADRCREVASDERMCLAVVGLQPRERLVGVDTRETEQRGEQVGVVGGDVDLA